MLQVVVLKKDALQVVDDDIDRPIGGVPQPGIVTPPGGNNLDLHERFFKVWKRALAGRLFDSRMERGLPVLLDGLSQPLYGRQRLINGQRDSGLAVFPAAPFLSEAGLLCGGAKGFRIVNQGKYLALQSERLLVSALQLCRDGAAVLQQIPLNGSQGFLDVDKYKVSPPLHHSHPGTYWQSLCLLPEYAVHI